MSLDHVPHQYARGLLLLPKSSSRFDETPDGIPPAFHVHEILDVVSGAWECLHLQGGWTVSTDRISPSSSMLELVRALDLSRKKKAGSGGQVPSRTPEESASPTHDLGALRRRLTALVSPINATDEGAVRAIRRPLLQEIILWEFGSDFRQHPEFAGMVEEVDQALDVDPRARERLARLVRQLQK